MRATDGNTGIMARASRWLDRVVTTMGTISHKASIQPLAFTLKRPKAQETSMNTTSKIKTMLKGHNNSSLTNILG